MFYLDNSEIVMILFVQIDLTKLGINYTMLDLRIKFKFRGKIDRTPLWPLKIK